jgi:molybdopterin-guanine dinucleotide biosynthesis adapter protein
MKIFGIAGYSGAGKTTLIEKLLPELRARGLKVSVIKHAHHEFDIDRPGKDSYRVREAGATEVMITGGWRWALLHELREEAEPTLADYLRRFSACDLVLVEGFKHEPIPKLEVHRLAAGRPPLYPDNPHVVALVTDGAPQTTLTCFGLDDAAAIAAFVLEKAVPPPPVV